MGWAETRIQQYNEGQKANWIERRILEHAHPVHLVLQVLGSIPFIYGLWKHKWSLTVAGIVLNLLGHLWPSVLLAKKIDKTDLII